ncbi:hypothetical protein KQY30_01795 [Streptomyces sp. GMY02]|uniref:hypothetical protein n=1 Tax=Streptomyces sp. GMY02 TaxID=1333528 RepID=UPI001C2C6538|nr:hypothetical protein [Streptomyces sp. GMY02]QXE33216.1 hypothetical protein KQY30_01795 [Streptomyces sp. GMY02]
MAANTDPAKASTTGTSFTYCLDAGPRGSKDETRASTLWRLNGTAWECLAGKAWTPARIDLVPESVRTLSTRISAGQADTVVGGLLDLSYWGVYETDAPEGAEPYTVIRRDERTGARDQALGRDGRWSNTLTLYKVFTAPGADLPRVRRLDTGIDVVRALALFTPPPATPPATGGGSPEPAALTPEEESRLAAYHKTATGRKDEVGGLIDRIAKATGGRLVGTEYALKSLGSLREKVLRIREEHAGKPGPAAQPLPLEVALAVVADLHRYTILYDPAQYAAKARDACAALRETYLDQVLRDYWSTDYYKGFNTSWQAKDQSYMIEVQFHTPNSYDTKSAAHVYYEINRALASGEWDRRACRALQVLANAELEIPPDLYLLPVKVPATEPDYRTAPEFQAALVRVKAQALELGRKAAGLKA